MTIEQLRRMLNTNYGIDTKWPNKLVVDHETYASVCQHIFEHYDDDSVLFWDSIKDGEREPDILTIQVMLGPNRGILFKGVELILLK